jgi:hypothetical protein
MSEPEDQIIQRIELPARTLEIRRAKPRFVQRDDDPPACEECAALRERAEAAEQARDEAITQLRTIVRSVPAPPWFEAEGGTNWEAWGRWLTDAVAAKEAAEGTLANLAKAARHLRSEVAGAWSIGEHGIRDAIGNTNYACVEQRLAELKAALAQASAGTIYTAPPETSADDAYNVCERCKERKVVCCGFDESARGLRDPLHPDKDFPGPSYCKDCCPSCSHRRRASAGTIPHQETTTKKGCPFAKCNNPDVCKSLDECYNVKEAKANGSYYNYKP